MDENEKFARRAENIRNLIDDLIRDRLDASGGASSGSVVDCFLFSAEHLMEESARVLRKG